MLHGPLTCSYLISIDQTSAKFSFSGAGSTVFSSKLSSSKPKDEESGGESGGEEGDTEAAHDPVFEPIVPLPDQIEVRTGEEEEDIGKYFIKYIYKF